MLPKDSSNHLSFLFSDNPPQLDNEYGHSSLIIHRFPNEAVYIYSLEKQSMVYLSGWEELLGFKQDEITLNLLVNLTTPEFKDFCSEMNKKALNFAFTLKEKFNEYSCLIETKKFNKKGQVVNLIEHAGIFKTENGKIIEIIAKYQRIKSRRLNNIRYFEAYGPDNSNIDEAFEEILSDHLAISGKEREVLQLAAKGLGIKEMADRAGVSHSAIEKRLMILYKRFKVSNNSHLISYAYEKGILP
jgi:DNA-binding CsgD family transcriptional regulator